MFDHVIAGFDGHDGGRDALAMAVALQPRRLTVVMAYGPETIVAPVTVADYWATLHGDAERRLAAACADLGVGAELAPVADTSPARALHKAAKDGAADLIVVGSAHRGRAGRLLLGDVSGAVLDHAPCAVAVAPKHLRDARWTPDRVGVAFDGGPEAVLALETAAALAADRGGQLVVLTAWEEPPSVAADVPYAASDLSASSEQRAHAVLDEGLALAGYRATGRLLHGTARHSLRDATEDLDLIVAGSRGWGPARRVLLGSTSRHLVRDARCAVLVVPRGAATAPEAPRHAEAPARATPRR